MKYLIKAEALVRSKERAANAGIEADAFMGEFLDLSARKDATGIIHYATFLTSAVYLEQSPQFQLLSEAEDGIKFTNLKVAIASLRNLQAAYDASNALIIPPGMEAIPSVASSVSSNGLFSTRVLKTVASW